MSESSENLVTWLCKECSFKSQGTTDYQHRQSAERHWVGYGWPHVVKPTEDSE